MQVNTSSRPDKLSDLVRPDLSNCTHAMFSYTIKFIVFFCCCFDIVLLFFPTLHINYNILSLSLSLSLMDLCIAASSSRLESFNYV
jgi:hypothetical protein